jgi:DNA-nicking Smr family endonuclease
MARRSRPKRDLTEQEKRLWAYATRHVAPLGARAHDDDDSTEEPKSDAESLARLLEQKPVSSTRRSSTKAPTAKTSTRRPRSDVPPQARLDLHGMTQDEAHSALFRFINMSVALGLKHVLVITGKGRSESVGVSRLHPNEGRGILRRLVPMWLEAESVQGMVEAIGSAPPKMGGSGALIISLKARSKQSA